MSIDCSLKIVESGVKQTNKQTFENFKCGSQYYRKIFFYLDPKCQLFNTSVAMYNVNESSITGL